MAVVCIRKNGTLSNQQPTTLTDHADIEIVAFGPDIIDINDVPRSVLSGLRALVH